MPHTFCCLCGVETPRAAVSAPRVFAANLLTVCPTCDDRETARRACVCRGHGWLVSTSSEYGTTIERCDSCAVFVNDFAAAATAKAAVRGDAATDDADVVGTSACEAFVNAIMHDRGIR
jgi:hypothetical protein